MSKVTLPPLAVHDLLAGASAQDQPLAGASPTLLVVLVGVALVLFTAMRALVAALLLLLMPLLALARSFVLVLALIGVLGYGMLNGRAEPVDPAPDTVRPSPTSVRARPSTPPPKPPKLPATPAPTVRSSLAAPGR